MRRKERGSLISPHVRSSLGETSGPRTDQREGPPRHQGESHPGMGCSRIIRGRATLVWVAPASSEGEPRWYGLLRGSTSGGEPPWYGLLRCRPREREGFSISPRETNRMVPQPGRSHRMVPQPVAFIAPLGYGRDLPLCREGKAVSICNFSKSESPLIAKGPGPPCMEPPSG